MIKLAGSTFAFGDISLEDSSKILSDMGFSYADVGGCGWSSFAEWVPQQVVQNIDDPQGEGDRIRKITESHGLQVSEFFICNFGHSVNHPDQNIRNQTRETFTKMAAIGKRAGFTSMMMLPGDVHDADNPLVEDLGQSKQEAWDLSVQELTTLVDIAESNGMRCNVECCIFSIAHHPDDCAKLMNAVPGLGATLDYAHQVQLELSQDEIEPMHEFARHVQCKQSAPGEFQARPDEGVIDFKRIMRKLKADNYDGVVSVEFVSSPEVLEKGWDLKVESARLKEILEEGLAE